MKGPLTNMKKILSITLILAMAISFCSCSNGGSSSATDKNSTDSTVSTAGKGTPTQAPTDPSIIPVQWQDNGIFSEYYEKAYTLMKTMTTEEKVGQVFYANCPTTDATEIAAQYQFGGYVLFGRDFENFSMDEVIANSIACKNATRIPMTLSVDEEGGTVTRISRYSQFGVDQFLSPREIFANGGLESIAADTQAKSNLLNTLNIDNNLAPVCDISTDPNDFIYDRALGETPEKTGEFVATVVRVSQENNIAATLKHFPGYGNNVDTHTGVAVDNRPYSQFEGEDFIPFKAGIDAGADCLLVSHNIMTCVDGKYPASLSADVHKIIRDKLGFTGIIMTDDCSMEAILDYVGDYDPAVIALNAGNDMVITGEYTTSYPAVLKAVNDGTISQDTIDHAVMRILAWKYANALM